MGHTSSDDNVETPVTAGDLCGCNRDAELTDERDSGPFNLELALGNCLGDREFLSQILIKFLAETERMIEKISQGIESGDLKKIEEIVHQLKGTAGLLGCMDLFRGISKLHNATKQNVEPDDLLKLLEELSAQYETVKECAKELGLC